MPADQDPAPPEDLDTPEDDLADDEQAALLDHVDPDDPAMT